VIRPRAVRLQGGLDGWIMRGGVPDGQMLSVSDNKYYVKYGEALIRCALCRPSAALSLITCAFCHG
jgi:hypothetical protein